MPALRRLGICGRGAFVVVDLAVRHSDVGFALVAQREGVYREGDRDAVVCLHQDDLAVHRVVVVAEYAPPVVVRAQFAQNHLVERSACGNVEIRNPVAAVVGPFRSSRILFVWD